MLASGNKVTREEVQKYTNRGDESHRLLEVVRVQSRLGCFPAEAVVGE